MKQLLKLTFLLLAYLLPASAVANPITLQQAQQNALSFLESKGKSISSSSLRQARLRSTSTTAESYYIFNIGYNEGYVIASGDDCAPAILGYADAGYIDVDSMPVNLQSWLEEYAQQIQFMQENGYSPSKAPKLTSSYSAISPLLATTWDQLDPYNQNCPDFFGYGKCVTGCVATAMAQVMYYHRARSVTQTTTQIPAYTCRHRWISGTDTMQIHVAAIPAGSPIDWDNMLDSYGSSATTAQEQAVANLMKYCGASVQMDYANEWNGGSGAYSTDVPTALKTYFDYSSATVLKNRSDYSTNDAWESLIYNELSSSRPVYYSGRNSSAGHAFVCDGYDGSGYYHINWGWSGTSDGYFLLTALDPDQQGTGGSSSGYNQNQAALINAQPKSSSPSNPVLATSISLNKTSATVTEGNTLQLTATVLPTNATNSTVTWKSSNTSVATVNSSGLVTAKSAGSATITATTSDGTNLSATCALTVQQNIIYASSISLNKTSATETEGNTLQLTATVLPSNATNKTVTWSTNNSSVANVNSNGVVTAISPGTATITARTTDGTNLSAYCSITVKQNSQGNIISFADTTVKALCVQNWDTNGDGELSKDEAAAVTSLNDVFKGKRITSFDELQYFTGLTIIGDRAFSSCSDLTSVTIPNSVTIIGNHAFENAYGLTNITIPNSVTTIGIGAFFNSHNLTSLTIPNSVTSIGDYAFRYCSNLSSLVISKSVTSIGKCAFAWCMLTNIIVENGNPNYDSRNNCNAIIETATNTLITGSSNTIIPNSVTAIGDYAFERRSGLTNFAIPNSVTAIGDYAFSECYSLVNVTIGNSVTSIGDNAFNACSSLVNVTIGNSVDTIGDYAFRDCEALTSIIIPTSVAKIGKGLFTRCNGLERITVDSDNPIYDSRNNCNAIIEKSSNTLVNGCKNTVIPNTVTAIGEMAFYDISELTSITIPNSVTAIGDDAFENCDGLTSVTIGSSVTSIGMGAFASIDYLKDVYSYIMNPSNVSFGNFAFFASETDTLHVPAGLANAYRNSTWGTFFENIVEMDPILAVSISLDKTYATVTEGNNLQLTATVLPTNATNKTITWSTSNNSVANVNSNGVVTAISPGTATITVRTTDGSNLSASCAVTVTGNLSDYDNYLSMEDVEAFRGDTIVIPIKMTNEASIISFQTDIFLPDGLELLQEDGEYLIDPSERMTRTHSIMSNAVASGAIRVLCYSSNYKPFTGNSGDDLFYITVKVADNAEGDYTIQLKNTLLTNTDFVDLAAPDVAANVNVKAYLLGDANNSGTVTITDVVVTAQYVLERNPDPFVFEAADVNIDGNITVTDVTRIAWIVLNPTLNAPRQAPALWDNGDHMSGEGINLATGETQTVSIALDNDRDYSAFQLDLSLPEGLTASNFQLTDRAGSHAFDVNALQNGSIRALCYSPVMTCINGHQGALLTFDVTATGTVNGDITVDGIELVTPNCKSVQLDGFTIVVNNATGVNETSIVKTVARMEYYNLAGQRLDRPESGVILVVTSYTDGTRVTSRLIKR